MSKMKFEAKNKIKGQYLGDKFGLWVAGNTPAEVLRDLDSKMSIKAFSKPYFVVTLNTEMLVLASENREFSEILRGADMLVPDGNGLRLLGVKYVYPGRKLVEDLLVMKKYRVFFLGGMDGVAKRMVERYGGDSDEGLENVQNSMFNVQLNSKIINRINKYKPDLLLVAYGAPWQEMWIYKNLDKLKAKVVIGVGGAFDYLTGKSKRVPGVIEKLGLEWLWRLVTEPKRWRRQLRLVRFVWLVLTTRFLTNKI